MCAWLIEAEKLDAVEILKMVEQPASLGPEPIHFSRLDGHRLWQSVEYRSRVLVDVIHQKLIMQMRAGGASGGTT